MMNNDYKKKQETQETTITSFERLANTTNGNPMYRLHTPHGVVTTAKDDMLTYSLSPNYATGKRAIITHHYNKKEDQAILDFIEFIT